MTKKSAFITGVVASALSGLITGGVVFGTMKHKENTKTRQMQEQFESYANQVLNVYDTATDYENMQQSLVDVNDAALAILTKIIRDYDQSAERINYALQQSLMKNFNKTDAQKIGVYDVARLWDIVRFGRVENGNLMFKKSEEKGYVQVKQRDGKKNVINKLIRANKIWKSRHKEWLIEYYIVHGDQYNIDTYRLKFFAANDDVSDDARLFWNMAQRGMYEKLRNQTRCGNSGFRLNIHIDGSKIINTEDYKKTIYDFSGIGLDMNNPYVAKYKNEINALMTRIHAANNIKQQRDSIINLQQQMGQKIR